MNYLLFTTKRGEFLRSEGVAAVLLYDERSRGGSVFAQGAGSYRFSDPMAPPTFVITAEQYNRIARLLQEKERVVLRLSLEIQASDQDVDGYNLIGELGGGEKKDEIVMIGAHLDSWHGGTGATDNAAGAAVMIEAMRLLKALNLSLDRTVRIGLWGGEEQGALGSAAYVKQHLGDPNTMKTTGEHARFSCYLNLDNGAGRVRGVYLQGNSAMQPIFEQWLSPFRDLGVTTVALRETGATDHLAFDAVGLPAFQLIQEPVDYNRVTHHSHMDTYDHVEAADLTQMSVVIA